MLCQCAGAQHVVCRDWRVSTVRDTLAQFSAPISSPPPRPKVWDCGCHGVMHPVCDPKFKRLTTEKPVVKVRTMTLKRALADGMTLRPHTVHVFRCQSAHDDTHAHCISYCDCGAMGPSRHALGSILAVAA